MATKPERCRTCYYWVHTFSCRQRIKKSKKGRDSGGVVLYIRNDIADTCEQILHSSDGVIEILTVYRQPDDSEHGHSSQSKEFIATLTKLKELILSIELVTRDIIFGGDLTYHIQLGQSTPQKWDVQRKKG